MEINLLAVAPSVPQLTDDDIRQRAPSVFAAQPIEGVSDRYSFVSTSSILGGMRDSGWVVTSAREQRVRKEYRRGFQMHLLRFSQVESVEERSPLRFEVRVTNSHDRSCAYRVEAGLLRLVCSNGLMAPDGTAGTIRIKHSHFDPARVVAASFEIAKHADALLSEVDGFKSFQLSDEEQVAFAAAARLLRWEDPAKAILPVSDLLVARRAEDSGSDLWSVFNRLQEHLVRGGQLGRTSTGHRTRVRGIKGIETDAKLNKALWALALDVRTGKLFSRN
jgi:hypothetical protein